MKEQLKKVWDRFRGRHEPAHEIAMSFAVGAAISFSPLLGLHFPLAILAAFLFRLNKLDVLLGTYIPVNPWTMVPIFTGATTIGSYLIHRHGPGRHLTRVPWHKLSSPAFWWSSSAADWEKALAPLGPILLSFALGSTIFAIVAGMLTYSVVIRIVLHHRQKSHPELYAADIARMAGRRAPLEPPPAPPTDRSGDG